MHILIAPNAFKHSLSAEDAAAAIQEGLKNSRFKGTTACFPVGDGGDGTASLLITHSHGKIEEAWVKNPLGKTIKAGYGLLDNDTTAVIEMANASGIRLLEKHELNPLKTSSFGTGEQIKVALDKGVKKIILGLGGSATVDGGMGILNALGIRFLDAAGLPVRPVPEKLIDLQAIDTTGLDPRILNCEVVILCDVNNTIVGKEGAAAVFGPQKGATPADVKMLEEILTRFSAISYAATGKDMSSVKSGGTAGGAAAGLHTFINARLVNGIDYFLDHTHFDKALEKADWVITGEGSIDEQTLQGKGPFGVAKRAKEKAVPVIGLAGAVPLSIHNVLSEYFTVLLSINNDASDLSTALKNTRKNLIRLSCELGNLLAAF